MFVSIGNPPMSSSAAWTQCWMVLVVACHSLSTKKHTLT